MKNTIDESLTISHYNNRHRFGLNNRFDISKARLYRTGLSWSGFLFLQVSPVITIIRSIGRAYARSEKSSCFFHFVVQAAMVVITGDFCF